MNSGNDLESAFDQPNQKFRKRLDSELRSVNKLFISVI